MVGGTIAHCGRHNSTLWMDVFWKKEYDKENAHHLCCVQYKNEWSAVESSQHESSFNAMEKIEKANERD